MSQPNQERVKTPEIPEYFRLNAQVGLPIDGKIQLQKDKEAVRSYFINHVNRNTTFFTTLEEKINYLVNEGYLKPEIINKYSHDEIKQVYKRAHGYKHRFTTFMGALKFYTQYALQDWAQETYLGRYEDTMVWCALAFADGDLDMALKQVDELMLGRVVPATPTMLNVYHARGGESTSCFPAGTKVSVLGGYKNIEDIKEGDQVLTHDGTYKPVTKLIINSNTEKLVDIKVMGVADNVITTLEHPILSTYHSEAISELANKDGATDNLSWVQAKDLTKGDLVAVPKALPRVPDIKTLNVASINGYSDKEVVEYEGLLYKTTKDKKNNKKKGHNRNVNNTPVSPSVVMGYGFGFLVGAFLAEGHCGDNAVMFTLNSNDTEYINAIYTQALATTQVTPNIRVNKDGSTNVVIHSKMMYEFIKNLVGTGYNKKLLSPTLLSSANEDFITGLMVGVFRGDGCMTDCSLKLTLVNTPLGKQLSELLSGLGIHNNTRVYDNAVGNATIDVTVPDSDVNQRTFIQEVGKNLHVLNTERKHNKSTSEVDGYELHKVTSTEEYPVVSTVYNLEVADNHTYVANGVVVHNCFIKVFQDNMNSIRRVKADGEALSSLGGGVSFNLINLREAGAPIKGMEGRATSGVLVGKVLEDIASYATQGGTRNGAFALYTHVMHPDIFKVLSVKKENADEKIRMKTISIGVVFPNIYYDLLERGETMYQFSVYDVERELGIPFSKVNFTKEYYNLVNNPKIGKYKVNTTELETEMEKLAQESGYPFRLNIDIANEASALAGTIDCSNIC